MIKGIIKTTEPDQTLKRMEIGELRAIFIQDILLTRTDIYISKDAETFTPEETGRGEGADELGKSLRDIPCVWVKRVGDGLTQFDFDLDFTEVMEPIEMMPESDRREIRDQPELFVRFTDCNIVIVDEKEEEEKDELTSLNEALAVAEREENFEEAARIRDAISKLGNVKKKVKK
ncbi:MAG: hypothetical protein JWM20_921 [Patescibacteria group bacterium]|nr:hypothetical protein [Patescibacteria group bacterium]